jgi:hypothetical protein
MTLTLAGDGVVAGLDGRSATEALSGLLNDLPDGVSGMPVTLGMSDFPSPRFQTRNRTGSDSIRGDPNPWDFPVGSDRPSPRTSSGRLRGRVAMDPGADGSAGESFSSADPPVTESRDAAPAGAAATRRPRHPIDVALEARAEAHALRSYGTGGAGYVYRDVVGADGETGGVFVGASAALTEGSTVQLHVRDSTWGKARVKELLETISEKTPRDAKSDAEKTNGSSSANETRGTPRGAVMYTCVSGNRMHAGDFREAVADCPLGGGFVAGEIGPSTRGARSSLQSHTSVVAVFREV